MPIAHQPRCANREVRPRLDWTHAWLEDRPAHIAEPRVLELAPRAPLVRAHGPAEPVRKPLGRIYPLVEHPQLPMASVAQQSARAAAHCVECARRAWGEHTALARPRAAAVVAPRGIDTPADSGKGVVEHAKTAALDAKHARPSAEKPFVWRRAQDGGTLTRPCVSAIGGEGSPDAHTQACARYATKTGHCFAIATEVVHRQLRGVIGVSEHIADANMRRVPVRLVIRRCKDGSTGAGALDLSPREAVIAHSEPAAPRWQEGAHAALPCHSVAAVVEHPVPVSPRHGWEDDRVRDILRVKAPRCSG
mmetsp:Transcript_4231/g.10927  ORF Transcript_4231/g.10927 Transcript_4231/m.10927 type:complete len:306 (+) Transcript_4231:195-1112(+)